MKSKALACLRETMMETVKYGMYKLNTEIPFICINYGISDYLRALANSFVEKFTMNGFPDTKLNDRIQEQYLHSKKYFKGIVCPRSAIYFVCVCLDER